MPGKTRRLYTALGMTGIVAAISATSAYNLQASADVTGARPGGAASDAAHEHQNHGTAAPRTPNSATPLGATGHHANAVAYDPGKIPAGARGSHTVRIGPTSQRPERRDGVGAFRSVCQYSHMRPDDPIVFPGKPGASHLHVFWGNTAANARSTAATIADQGRSTCRGGTANRTAYWAPALINTGTRTPLAPQEIHVYYKSGYRGVSPGRIRPLPAGLRMIAGDARAARPQATFMAGWRCWQSGTSHPSVPACRPGEQVAMHVSFPQCWDGRRLDSRDHRAHMAYAEPGRGCPPSHPVALPEISFNVLYRLPAGAPASAWRLSSDSYDSKRPGGFSIHGDWMNGWRDDIQRTWITKCVQSGLDCHSDLLGDGRTMIGDR